MGLADVPARAGGTDRRSGPLRAQLAHCDVQYGRGVRRPPRGYVQDLARKTDPRDCSEEL